MRGKESDFLIQKKEIYWQFRWAQVVVFFLFTMRLFNFGPQSQYYNKFRKKIPPTKVPFTEIRPTDDLTTASHATTFIILCQQPLKTCRHLTGIVYVQVLLKTDKNRRKTNSLNCNPANHPIRRPIQCEKCKLFMFVSVEIVSFN